MPKVMSYIALLEKINQVSVASFQPRFKYIHVYILLKLKNS